MAFLIIATMYLNSIEIFLSIILCSYLVTFLLIYFGWQKLPETNLAKIEKPVTVSIIIAARNEIKTLPLLLSDLYRQVYPRNLYDIIIIDDHSDQRLASQEQIRSYQVNNLRVFDLPESKQGKKQALLEGVKKSDSELLLFTDCDCRLGPKWIQTFVQNYVRNSSEFMIGLIDYKPMPGIIQGFFRADFISLVISGAGTASLGFATLCNGANLAVKRSSYNKYAGYLKMNIPSGDDVYMLHALKKHNKKAISVVKNSAGIVRTKSPENSIEFFNQRIRWASKGIRYNDLATILLALLVLLTNLIICVTPILCLLELTQWWIFINLFATKAIADYLILITGLWYFGGKKTILMVPFYELVYPLYATITPILGMFNFYSWKGRTGRE